MPKLPDGYYEEDRCPVCAGGPIRRIIGPGEPESCTCSSCSMPPCHYCSTGKDAHYECSTCGATTNEEEIVMKIENLSKVQTLVKQMGACKKQIKVIESGCFKIRDNYGEVLDFVPHELLEVGSPIQLILLNGLTKKLDSIERNLEELGVTGR